jgi:hypothetical protein
MMAENENINNINEISIMKIAMSANINGNGVK